MNKLCKECDTRIRLKKCKGKDFNKKYCYRNCGVKDVHTIVQFDTLDELFPQIKLELPLKRESLKITDYTYNNKIKLLIGSLYLEGKEKELEDLPLGYIMTDDNK